MDQIVGIFYVMYSNLFLRKAEILHFFNSSEKYTKCNIIVMLMPDACPTCLNHGLILSSIFLIHFFFVKHIGLQVVKVKHIHTS